MTRQFSKVHVSLADVRIVSLDVHALCNQPPTHTKLEKSNECVPACLQLIMYFAEKSIDHVAHL